MMSLHRPPLRLFALIIGINEYESPNITNLLGAVPDAHAVLDYLQKHLRIPSSSSQIRILLDNEATRAAIIDGIKAFSLSDDIKKGDPILIYYAGHGGSADTPNGLEVGGTGKIELLIPYDHSPPLVDGDLKYGIPDRTLGALLSHLANEKGNNIVRQIFIIRGFIYQLITVRDRLSFSIAVIQVLAHEILWTPPTRLEVLMSDMILLILIEIFGVSRVQNAEQKSLLALLGKVLGPMSFWQHVTPKSQHMSGRTEEYLLWHCSRPLWPSELAS